MSFILPKTQFECRGRYQTNEKDRGWKKDSGKNYCGEKKEIWEAGAKGQQWVTDRLRWHKQLQSDTVCHVDGLHDWKGPRRKGPFHTVPRGHLRRQTEQDLVPPPTCLPFCCPGKYAHRQYISLCLFFSCSLFLVFTVSVPAWLLMLPSNVPESFLCLSLKWAFPPEVPTFSMLTFFFLASVSDPYSISPSQPVHRFVIGRLRRILFVLLCMAAAESPVVMVTV